MFGLQVLACWLILCLPGNFVTVYLYFQHANLTTIPTVTNVTGLKCHEEKANWSSYVNRSKFLMQGVSCTIIGIFGFCANLLSICVLVKCKDNKNFHRLLASLAVIDILLITDLVFEMSIIGVFMQREPIWFILAYPYFIHPCRGIIQTCAIFMVVAVATERYRQVGFVHV